MVKLYLHVNIYMYNYIQSMYIVVCYIDLFMNTSCSYYRNNKWLDCHYAVSQTIKSPRGRGSGCGVWVPYEQHKQWNSQALLCWICNPPWSLHCVCRRESFHSVESRSGKPVGCCRDKLFWTSVNHTKVLRQHAHIYDYIIYNNSLYIITSYKKYKWKYNTIWHLYCKYKNTIYNK